MAGGFAKDGAVQDQIDATIEDAVNRARSQLPQGKSLRYCEECDTRILEASLLQACATLDPEYGGVEKFFRKPQE